MERLFWKGVWRVVKEKCDVLILSASYGGGHNQVASALTQALKTQAPDLRVSTVDYCNLLLPIINRLSQFGYLQSIRHFPMGYALYYQATGKMSSDSFWQKRLNRMGYSELILLINRLQPQVIVSTFPLPAGVLSEMKEAGEIHQPLVTVITDICVHSQWIHPSTDLYIVGSEEVASGLKERGTPQESISVTGIPILPVFNQQFFRDLIRARYQLDPDDKVIIFMAGSDGMFGTTRFNQILADLSRDVKAFIITGSNQELYDRLSLSYAGKSNLRVLKFIENVAELLEIADILVTKAGGITISEALAKGVPMIIYKPVPGQEEANANFLWRHRAAIIAKSEYRLRTAIDQLVNREELRMRFRRNCLKIGNPDSAESSAREILKLMSPVARYAKLLPNAAPWLVDNGYLNLDSASK